MSQADWHRMTERNAKFCNGVIMILFKGHSFKQSWINRKDTATNKCDGIWLGVEVDKGV